MKSIRLYSTFSVIAAATTAAANPVHSEKCKNLNKAFHVLNKNLNNVLAMSKLIIR